ncbi:RNA polymerase II subunit A C-terminal domain phosphatase SSU72-like [Teleopsis dalmanni]|uniref:RNA polymerase II subunit A C-terminal domain phosphatase SSU72-like n=1 Tax=Teleopsis dalmanni TaxID=139649 RepID=UPI0018CCD090|nr:RNA polymerase II subunit A C-terminal domain phosphatase SSU72-like [Teleopsis dalmanni]
MPKKDSLSVAVICASNMNRSMNAHLLLKNKGFDVKSYGVGDLIRIAGKTRNKPNYYPFGTSYQEIYNDLVAKDKKYYKSIGFLKLLERNRTIKNAPERFQDCTEQFDLIVTVEQCIFEQVVKTIQSHYPTTRRYVHVVNIDVEDCLQKASYGSVLIAEFLTKIAKSKNWRMEISYLIHDFQSRHKKRVLHTGLLY